MKLEKVNMILVLMLISLTFHLVSTPSDLQVAVQWLCTVIWTMRSVVVECGRGWPVTIIVIPTQPVQVIGIWSHLPLGLVAEVIVPLTAVIAIQQRSPDAFLPYHEQSQISIDDYYVEGVSITYGEPRLHVWTFAGYVSDVYTVPTTLCPCSQPSLSIPSPPSFVGNNYFCDTAAPILTGATYYTDDPLWDGQGCGGPSTCCSFNNPPWFSTALPETTSDDIEVRICGNQSPSNEDTPITILDLYIQ